MADTGSIAITGDDTIVLYDRVFNDFAEGDVGALTFQDDLADTKTGKNKNSLFAKKESGNNGVLALRLLIGSSDDKFMNSKLESMDNDFSKFIVISGQFTKKVGDGLGNVANVTYDLEGGIFQKRVEQKENVDGDVTQAVAVYTMKFVSAKRRIA